jgi:YjbE family integral membrane protein
METGVFLLALLQIIWINVLLSGDNAVVIALACRSLPPETRKWGILFGAGAAVLLRIIFTVIVTTLMGLPYLKIIGGILLLWIAVQLLTDETDESDIAASHSVWAAVRTIVIADIIMSLDNVVAIAAAAKGSWTLIIIGLAVSVPMIVFGATLLMTVLQRYPVLVWAGAALLGWVAGGLIIEDPLVKDFFVGLLAKPGVDPSVTFHELVEPFGGIVGAVLVTAVGWLMRRHERPERDEDVEVSG